MMRGRAFAKDYGTLIVDGPFEGVSARAVVVIDAGIAWSTPQLVREIGDEPDYDAALRDLGVPVGQCDGHGLRDRRLPDRKVVLEEAIAEGAAHATVHSPPGRVNALRGVDLHVKTGEIFGLLGPERRGQDHARQDPVVPDPAGPRPRD